MDLFAQSAKFIKAPRGMGRCDRPASKSDAARSGVKGNRGDISTYSEDSRSAAETDEVKWAGRQRPFGLAIRARMVRLRQQQPKQSGTTAHRPGDLNLAPRGIKADFGAEHAYPLRHDVNPVYPE